MKTKRINPADYTEHKNYEQIKLFCIYSLLGEEPEVIGGRVCCAFPGFKHDPILSAPVEITPEIVLRLMEWIMKEGYSLLFVECVHEATAKHRLGKGSVSVVADASVNCALAVAGEMDCPKELLNE